MFLFSYSFKKKETHATLFHHDSNKLCYVLPTKPIFMFILVN